MGTLAQPLRGPELSPCLGIPLWTTTSVFQQQQKIASVRLAGYLVVSYPFNP